MQWSWFGKQKNNNCWCCDSKYHQYLFLSCLAKGIDDIAEMYKYNIVLANSDEDDEKQGSFSSQHTLSKQVDGIIFMGYHLTEKIRSEFSRSRTPVGSCRNSGCRTSASKCQY